MLHQDITDSFILNDNGRDRQSFSIERELKLSLSILY